MPELGLDGRRLVICRYPFRAWNGRHRNASDLHGRGDGPKNPMPRQLFVGVDACEFAPLGMPQLTGATRARADLGL